MVDRASGRTKRIAQRNGGWQAGITREQTALLLGAGQQFAGPAILWVSRLRACRSLAPTHQLFCFWSAFLGVASIRDVRANQCRKPQYVGICMTGHMKPSGLPGRGMCRHTQCVSSCTTGVRHDDTRTAALGASLLRPPLSRRMYS